MSHEENRNLTARDVEKLIGRKVTTLKTRMLTAPGENYGSIMLAVDATLNTGRDVALVAKMFPASDISQSLFQSPISMKKEIDVYQIISPEYERIQEEQSVPPSQRLHVFCSCPGARLTLGDKDEDQLADKNAVMLLENLRVQGYRTGDRFSGMDKKHTEFVLEHLAKFHATAVAIKLKKPLVFRNKLLKVLTPFKIKVGTKKADVKFNEKFVNGLLSIPACNRNIDALKDLLMESVEYAHSDTFRPVREPYATFTHYDLWTNNMMFKYKSETDGDPVDLKFVDFQVSMCGSPVSDIMLFLFTSTQTGIVSEHIDHFLELYHSYFVDWLKILRCETKHFSYEYFLEEVKIVAPLSLSQIMIMLMPITLNKGQVDKFTEAPRNEESPVEFMPVEFNDVYILKISEALDTYVEKNWL